MKFIYFYNFPCSSYIPEIRKSPLVSEVQYSSVHYLVVHQYQYHSHNTDMHGMSKNDVPCIW